MDNEHMAKILDEIADILGDQGVAWKPAAYRKAAQTIRSSEVKMKDVYDEGGTKALIEIPTIGRNIAKEIEEMLNTDDLEYYEKLKKGDFK